MTKDQMIGELKKVKPSYNYDRYDDRQIFRMYQRYVVDKAPKKDIVTQQEVSVNTPIEKSIEDYEQEYDDQMGYRTCDNCGTRLNDMGTCPRCDEGEEDLNENINSSKTLKEGYNLSDSAKQCLDKLIKYCKSNKKNIVIADILVYFAMIDEQNGDAEDEEFTSLEDGYDWDSNEGLAEIVDDLEYTIQDLDEEEYDYYYDWWNADSLYEGIRIDNEPFEIGSRVAERWDDGEFNVGSIINIKKDETGTQYLVQWDYSDLNNMQWLYGDELTHWLDDIEENFTIDDEYTNSTTEDKICVICGATIERYGNNADPIADGICCDKCNREQVIPARLKMHFDKKG